MSSHLLTLQIIHMIFLPFTTSIPSAACAITHAMQFSPSLNAANAQFHCTDARAWTTNTHVDLQAADCKKAIEEFICEADRRHGEGVEWGTPYWANPRAFDRPLGHPTVWTPVRYASGTCVLAIVLMGQAGQIPDKPAPPYEEKVLESWITLSDYAQLLWGECVLLRTRVGWIRVGGSSLGVFLYNVESNKDNEIRGMRPWFTSLGFTNTSNILLADSQLHDVSSA